MNILLFFHHPPSTAALLGEFASFKFLAPRTNQSLCVTTGIFHTRQIVFRIMDFDFESEFVIDIVKKGGRLRGLISYR